MRGEENAREEKIGEGHNPWVEQRVQEGLSVFWCLLGQEAGQEPVLEREIR